MQSKAQDYKETISFYIGFYSYNVLPRKQRNWKFIYLASIKINEELSATVAEGSIFN